MLTPFQQLLMQATGAAPAAAAAGAQPPAQAQPAPPAPAQSEAPQPYGQSRVDRMLRKYDQFAGGGMDFGALSAQQRSLLRRQLGLNLVGAAMQGMPLAVGANAHLANVGEMQKKMAEEQRQRQLRDVFAGGDTATPTAAAGPAPQGGLPIAGAGGGERARMIGQYQQLLRMGFFEDAAALSEQIDRLFPDETFTDADVVLGPDGKPTLVRQGNRGTVRALDGYAPAIEASQANLIDRVEGINPITGETMWARDTGMTDYQRQRLGQGERDLALRESKAAGGAPEGVGGPNTFWDATTKILYRQEGDKWKPDPTFGRRYDAAQSGIVRFENLATDAQRLAVKARSLADSPALSRVTGVMGVVPSVPGGEAATAASELESIRSQVSVAALQRMREMSATGGAVGQVTEKEWPRLESALQNLNGARKTEDVRRALTSLADTMDDITAKYESAANRQFAPILAVDNDGVAPVVKFGRSGQAAQDEWAIEEID